jgi:hypothetical protein
MEGTYFLSRILSLPHTPNYYLPTHSLTHSRVAGQPSTKADRVFLGDGAGRSKLAAVGLSTLSEEEFLNLIAKRKGPGGKYGRLDEQTGKKMEKKRREIEGSAKDGEGGEEESTVVGGESTPFFPFFRS